MADLTRKELFMSDELLSFGIVSALVLAMIRLKIALDERKAEKSLKKIPIRVRRYKK